MLGEVFGNYKVIAKYPYRTKERRIQWVVVDLTTRNCYIKTGKALNRIKPPKSVNNNTCKKHPLYRTYTGMKTRCYNVHCDAYHYYGGRGVIVCKRWLQSFWNFVEDVGERPLGTTLDRINNEGNYEPGNTRWATRQEQANNRRPNSGWRKRDRNLC